MIELEIGTKLKVIEPFSGLYYISFLDNFPDKNYKDKWVCGRLSREGDILTVVDKYNDWIYGMLYIVVDSNDYIYIIDLGTYEGGMDRVSIEPHFMSPDIFYKAIYPE
jgi:hypothetical protein